MTTEQYQQRRDALLSQIADVESASSGDKSVKNRSVKEIVIALAALDADAASQGLAASGGVASRLRIGRMYVSGEGK